MQRGWIIPKLLVGFGMSNVGMAPRARLQERPSICALQEVDHVAENSGRVRREWACFPGTALQLLQGVPADPTFVALAAFCVRFDFLSGAGRGNAAHQEELLVELRQSLSWKERCLGSGIANPWLSRSSRPKRIRFATRCVAHTQMLNYHQRYCCKQ